MMSSELHSLNEHDIIDGYLTDFSTLLKVSQPELPSSLLNRANGRTLPADPSKVRCFYK